MRAASGREPTSDSISKTEVARRAIAEAIGGYGSHVPTEYLLMPVTAASFEIEALRNDGIPPANIVHGVKLAAEAYRTSTGQDLSARLTHMLTRAPCAIDE